MILGVPKEILKNETRVAVIPATVKQLISAGFDIFIESGAGDLSQISDSEYTASGAKIFNTANEIYENCAKVKILSRLSCRGNLGHLKYNHSVKNIAEIMRN